MSWCKAELHSVNLKEIVANNLTVLLHKHLSGAGGGCMCQTYLTPLPEAERFPCAPNGVDQQRALHDYYKGYSEEPQKEMSTGCCYCCCYHHYLMLKQHLIEA